MHRRRGCRRGNVDSARHQLARACAACGKTSDGSDRWGGPDPCLGRLPGLIGACCGHGVTPMYAWTDDGVGYTHREAWRLFRSLGGNPPLRPVKPGKVHPLNYQQVRAA